MISKREIMERIWMLEVMSNKQEEELYDLIKRVKKLEPNATRDASIKKEKKSVKVSK